MKQKIIKFFTDLLILVLSFELSELIAVKLIKSDKWYIELLVYLALFALLHAVAVITKYIIKKAKQAKIKKLEKLEKQLKENPDSE